MILPIRIAVCFASFIVFTFAENSFENEHQLKEAIQQDRINEIRRLIRLDVDVNYRYEDGQRPIHVAVQNGYTNIVKLLAANHANLSYHNSEGYTPLHLAVLKKKQDIIEALVENNANLDIQDNVGRTPLNISLAMGQMFATEYLIENGAEVPLNLKEWEQLALGCALRTNSDMYDKLTGRGVPLKSRWRDENTFGQMIIEGNVNATISLIKMCDMDLPRARKPFPLHLAVELDRVEIISILIENGADKDAVNDAGLTPLFNTTLNAARILIRNRANVNAKDSHKSTPLHIASKTGKDKVVQLLIRHGATVDAKDDMNQTALHLAAAAKIGSDRVTKILIRNSASLNAKTGSGQTPLHIAAKNGNVKVAEILIENGANLSLEDNEGRTPHDLAVSSGNANIIAVVIGGNSRPTTPSTTTTRTSTQSTSTTTRSNFEAPSWLNFDFFRPKPEPKPEPKPDPILTCPNDWMTKLEEFVKKDNTDGVEAVIKLCPVNLSTMTDPYPLFFAVRHNNVRLVEFLIQNGANVNIKGPQNANGYKQTYNLGEDFFNRRSPLHLAAAKGNVQIAEILIRNGADVSAPDSNQFTPLHNAAQYSKEKVVDLLIRSGANLYAVAFNTLPMCQALSARGFGTVEDRRRTLRLFKKKGQVLEDCLYSEDDIAFFASV